MSRKQVPSDHTGPMGMQPIERSRSAPTQMLPMMPGAGPTGARPAKPSGLASVKKPRTRTEAIRAARARILRRKSLAKQRDAQKS